MLKKKYADQRNVKAIKDKKFKNIRIKDDEFLGAVSLIKVNKVSVKWEVPRNNGITETILDNNYKWLMLYPKNEKYIITAMYNENQELVEFYFDAAKTVKYKASVPYIKDLYLDVVLTKNNEVIYLDEEELKEALKKSTIKRKDYDFAKLTADRIVSKYHRPEEFENLKQMASKYLNELLESMEDKKAKQPIEEQPNVEQENIDQQNAGQQITAQPNQEPQNQNTDQQ